MRYLSLKQTRVVTLGLSHAKIKNITLYIQLRMNTYTHLKSLNKNMCKILWFTKKHSQRAEQILKDGLSRKSLQSEILSKKNFNLKSKICPDICSRSFCPAKTVRRKIISVSKRKKLEIFSSAHIHM